MTSPTTPQSTPPFAAAGIDVGTNSVLLTIARRGGDGRLAVLDERSVITRLGQGLGQRGELLPEAMERTLAVLSEFGAALLALGARARAAGTSALRRAENAQRFLDRAREALGVPLEVLSGAEEARLGYRGALSELPGVDPALRPMLLDPGGGSTEVVGPTGALSSLEVGAVRLTEAFLRSDPPTEEEIEALLEHVRAVLTGLEPAGGRPVVAAGGTATTLAAISLGLERYDGRRVHGSKVSLAAIGALRARLARLPLSERQRIPCLQPKRADIAVAGALLLEQLLIALEVPEVVVTDRGLRFGLIEELLEQGS